MTLAMTLGVALLVAALLATWFYLRARRAEVAAVTAKVVLAKAELEELAVQRTIHASRADATHREVEALDASIADGQAKLDQLVRDAKKRPTSESLKTLKRLGYYAIALSIVLREVPASADERGIPPEPVEMELRGNAGSWVPEDVLDRMADDLEQLPLVRTQLEAFRRRASLSDSEALELRTALSTCTREHTTTMATLKELPEPGESPLLWMSLGGAIGVAVTAIVLVLAVAR